MTPTSRSHSRHSPRPLWTATPSPTPIGNASRRCYPGESARPVAPGDDNHRFLNAVVWIARNGGPWRDLPAGLGHWNTVWRRFDRWARGGVWPRLFEHFQDPDLEWLLLDSTSVRAHQHAAGARKRGSQPSLPRPARRSGAPGWADDEGPRRLRRAGNSIRLVVTPGQRGDVTQAAVLLEGLSGAVVADTAYDAGHLVRRIARRVRRR